MSRSLFHAEEHAHIINATMSQASGCHFHTFALLRAFHPETHTVNKLLLTFHNKDTLYPSNTLPLSCIFFLLPLSPLHSFY